MKLRIPLPTRLPRMQKTVRVKLTTGFLMVAAIVLVAVIAGILSVQRVADTSNEIVDRHVPRTIAIYEAKAAAVQLGDRYTESLLQLTLEDVREVASEADDFDGEARFLLAALSGGDGRRGLVRMERAVIIEPLEAAVEAYEAFHRVGVEMVGAHVRDLEEGADIGSGIEYMDEFHAARESLITRLAELQSVVEADIDTARQDAQETQVGAFSVMGVILVVSFLAAIGIGWFVSRQITVPLRRAVRFAETIASGDLSTRMHARAGDELGDLAKALNEMTDKLSTIIGMIKISSDDLASAAEEISATTRSISEMAETQSSAAEETSASMEEMAASIEQVSSSTEQLGSSADETAATIGEMAASVEQIAHSIESLSTVVDSTTSGLQVIIQFSDAVAGKASNVSGMTQEAGALVNEGVSAVDTMAESMAAIAAAVEGTVEVVESLGKRSKEIGDITDVIDGIAEQTNLLALNAAIEAARAGQHGRGFAVVAEAVRELAERSTDSTKEISQLISSIQADTDEAVKAALVSAKWAVESQRVSSNARDMLHRIRETTDKIISAMNQISSATAEQAGGGQTLLAEVEEMKLLHHQVQTAIHEQAQGSQQIVTAVEYTTKLVLQVVSATDEQRRGSGHMVTAMDSIAQATRTNLTSISELGRAANNLAGQSSKLSSVIEDFKLK